MVIHNKVIENIKNEEINKPNNNNSLVTTTPINQSSSISLTTPINTVNTVNTSLNSPINSFSINASNHNLSFTPIKKIDIESENINVFIYF